MFPHPCGEQFEKAVAAGADPAAVVPNEYAVAKGGSTPIPGPGVLFSGAVGPTPELAAAAVPHGQVQLSTVGAIRDAGGRVTWVTEVSRAGTLNRQHVNITEAGPTSFSALITNPVPRRQRIDGTVP
jgi:hypothetical protein